MRVVRRAVLLVLLPLVLAACPPGDSTPTPTPTPTPAAQAGKGGTTGQAGAPPVLSLPWPDGVQHTWTGGPHGWDPSCASTNCIGAAVPDRSQRSGLDFGTGGKDWDVYPVAAGTVLYKGSFSDGFGAGVVIDHGGSIVVLYGHMDEGSLSATPDKGKPVTRTTKLGSTWCTGMLDGKGQPNCTATTGAHHLHLELRALTTKDGVASWTQPLGWNGRTIGGWTISVPLGNLNYNGTATACGGEPVAADANKPPSLSDATDCSTAAAPTPTPAPLVLSGTWVAPKDSAELKTSTLTLSAKPSASLPDVKITKVAYTVQWGSAKPETACTATKADANGVWTCKAPDLWKLGAPLGKLTLSFDVTVDTAGATLAPVPTRTVTFAAPPPAPTSVTRTGSWDGNEENYTTVVRWEATGSPITDGFVIYAAQIYVGHPMPGDPPSPACPKPPFKGSGIYDTIRKFVIRVGPGTRRTTVTVPYGAAIDCGIWVAAYNAAGTSRLVPVHGTRSPAADRPAAPTGVTLSPRGAGRTISCDGSTCFYEPSGGPSPWRLTWKDVASETGYRVYVAYDAWYFVADKNVCVEFVHQPRQLIAKLPANTISLKGTWTAEGDGTKAHPYISASTYYVVAINGAGASKASASRRIAYVDTVGECAVP